MQLPAEIDEGSLPPAKEVRRSLRDRACRCFGGDPLLVLTILGKSPCRASYQAAFMFAFLLSLSAVLPAHR